MHHIITSWPLAAPGSWLVPLWVVDNHRTQSNVLNLQTFACAQLCWHSTVYSGKLITSLGNDEEFLFHLRNLTFPSLPTMKRIVINECGLDDSVLKWWKKYICFLLCIWILSNYFLFPLYFLRLANKMRVATPEKRCFLS